MLEKALKEIIREQQETLFPLRLVRSQLFRRGSEHIHDPTGKRSTLRTGSSLLDFPASVGGRRSLEKGVC